MEIKQINFSTPAFSTSSFSEDSDLEMLIQIQDQILRDPTISEAEKHILLQLGLASDETVGTFTMNEQIQPRLEQLIAEYGDSPYAYLYHCLNGMTYIHTDLDKVIQEMDASIQLNPNFHVSYFFRASANIQKNNFAEAVKDLQIADQLGNRFAHEILKEFGI